MTDTDKQPTFLFRDHVIFGDIHSRAQIKRGDHAINGRFERKASLDFLRGDQVANIRLRHSRQSQPLKNAFSLGRRTAGFAQQ